MRCAVRRGDEPDGAVETGGDGDIIRADLTAAAAAADWEVDMGDVNDDGMAALGDGVDGEPGGGDAPIAP